MAICVADGDAAVHSVMRADLCDAISNSTLHAAKKTIVGSLEASVTLATRVPAHHCIVTSPAIAPITNATSADFASTSAPRFRGRRAPT